MNMMKIQLKWACRVEHLASGFYHTLSNRYRKQGDVSKILSQFSKDELKHGLMFKKGYRVEFGKNLTVGPWVTLGKALAFLQYPVPLRWKLKNLNMLESVAVKLMNHDLSTEGSNRYKNIVRLILPDEEKHAAFYDKLYAPELPEENRDNVVSLSGNDMR